jgi:hypothetical protein
MDGTKVKKAKKWQVPTYVTKVWKFLGFTGYLPLLHQGLLKASLHFSNLCILPYPSIGILTNKTPLKHSKMQCVRNQYSINLISLNHSTSTLMHQHMAWEPYSHKREISQTLALLLS